LAIAALLAAGTGLAHADALQDLTAKVEALQREIADMKKQQTAASPANAVTGGATKGSFKLPGSDTSVTVGGYVKLDALYSSRSAGTNSAADQLLDPTAIAVGLTAGVNELHQITLHARQSRLFVRTATLTTWGDVNTPLEFDLFGTSGNESVSNSHNLRLRHAYGTLGGLLAGQTWSNFMMVSALPETLDFGGPAGQTFVRQAQVRWTQPFSGGQWSVALENPETVVTRPDGSSLRADDDRVFDLTGNIGFKTTRRGRRQCHWPVLGWSADRRFHRQYGQSGLARSGRRLRRLPARLDPTASINAGARGLEGDQSELRRRHSDAAHGVGPPESDLEPGGQHQHRCRVHLATNEGGLVIVRPARRRITAICRPVG